MQNTSLGTTLLLETGKELATQQNEPQKKNKFFVFATKNKKNAISSN